MALVPLYRRDSPELSPDMETVTKTLILNFPACRTVRNGCLLFQPPILNSLSLRNFIPMGVGPQKMNRSVKGIGSDKYYGGKQGRT